MAKKKKDLYNILDVAPNASKDEIKKKYREKAKKLHPDLNNGGNHDIFAELSRAHAILIDDTKRAHYDKTGDDGENPNSLNQAAIQRLMMIINNVIDQYLENPQIIEEDWIAAVKKQLVQVDGQMNKDLEGVERKIKRIKKLESRFKYSGEGPNMLEILIQDRLTSLNKQKFQIQTEIDIVSCVQVLLNEYTFEFVRREDRWHIIPHVGTDSSTAFGFTGMYGA